MSNQKTTAAKILKCLEEQGWRIERKSRGWMAFPPDVTKPPVTVHLSNSDHRWIKNTERDARKGGFVGKFPV